MPAPVTLEVELKAQEEWPNSRVVWAAAVKLPVAVPPPSRSSVPELTVTMPSLTRAISLNAVVPVPAVFSIVPWLSMVSVPSPSQVASPWMSMVCEDLVLDRGAVLLGEDVLVGQGDRALIDQSDAVKRLLLITGSRPQLEPPFHDERPRA